MDLDDAKRILSFPFSSTVCTQSTTSLIFLVLVQQQNIFLIPWIKQQVLLQQALPCLTLSKFRPMRDSRPREKQLHIGLTNTLFSKINFYLIFCFEHTCSTWLLIESFKYTSMSQILKFSSYALIISFARTLSLSVHCSFGQAPQPNV